jgi:hypothetical protein
VPRGSRHWIDPDRFALALAADALRPLSDSVGNYHVNMDANAVGVWYYRFQGTGANQSAAEDQLEVVASQF